MINRTAGATLPATVPAFLRAPSALDSLSYYAPLPDHWRGSGEPELTLATAPEHYIALETVDPLFPQGLPRNRYDYIRALALDQAKAQPGQNLSAEKIGLQPYQTDEVWQRLKVAFRDYRQATAAKEDTHAVEAEVIFLAGWLGHYVGDGSMPLHTSDKPNGWMGPNPNGYTTEHHIHGLFESEFVRVNIKPEEIAPLVARDPVVIDDVFTQYVGYLHKNHAFVEDVYRLEKAGAFNGAGTPAGRQLADQQLAAAATELRDLIYSAWVHSGDPIPERH
jgi:hypothetical protein